ncbi:MAG TPA: DnaB-like helicase N-terminal domain-containing protein [Thermoleophilia bacterium]|nr:DnaB-like helicase N-terminal domain-containing protein [Thermoleophilia bacterium]
MSAQLHFDEAAELAVLGCLLTPSANGARDPGGLRPEDFYKPTHGLIFRACRDLAAAGEPVDALTVSNRLQKAGRLEEVGGRAFVHSLADALYPVTNLPTYAGIVRDHARRREEVRIGQALEAGELTAEEAGRALEALAPVLIDTPELSDAFIDWSVFWERDRTQADWIYEDLLARGRGHALYAVHKGGKSLLMLSVSVQLATGPEPIVVIYLDYEMGEADIYERLEDMGYGPGSDLSRLRYALLPSLPPLDTAAGARALTALVDAVQGEWPEHHLVVILDTMGRAVAGEENSSDTFRAFYTHTGIELKRRGITYARLDHGGKDIAKGQRGSSGKGDDVDVVWRLTKTEGGIRLDLDVARMNWVPKKVTFGIHEDPLRYVQVDSAYPVGTTDTAELLDNLEVPLEASVRTAQEALKEAGEGRRQQVIRAALKWRREHQECAS